MSPDGEIEFHHNRCIAPRGLDIAIRLFDDRRLGRAAGLELAWRCARVENDRQIFDFDGNEIGCVLRHVRIGCEYSSDRLADITQARPRQDRLAIWCPGLNW